MPVLSALAQRGVPTIVTGFVGPGDHFHAANESMRLTSLALGERAARELYLGLARLPAEGRRHCVTTHRMRSRDSTYKRRAWGGKARSVAVPGPARSGRRPLPGEHGFRIFFGFYKCNADTFRRIPYGTNPIGVFDNLTPVPQFNFARAGRRDVVIPIDTTSPAGLSPALVEQTAVALALENDLPPDAAAYFGRKLVVFMSSCRERRLGQGDNTPWSEFVQADRWDGDYREVFSETFTHVLQASRAGETSTAFVGWFLENGVYNLAGGVNANGAADRILDEPTSEALIDPWIVHLNRYSTGDPDDAAAAKSLLPRSINRASEGRRPPGREAEGELVKVVVAWAAGGRGCSAR